MENSKNTKKLKNGMYISNKEDIHIFGNSYFDGGIVLFQGQNKMW